MSAIESLDSYLARGGKITVSPPGGKKYDYANIYRNDKQLTALRLLKQQVSGSEKVIAQIDKAICIRLEILKISY